MGQLGGRRGDPRRRHRPVHRPGQAALHRLRGPLFSVKGPSITPRPPQGQPIVAALAHGERRVPTGRPITPTSGSSRRTTPRGAAAHRRRVGSSRPRRARRRAVHVFADLVVFLDDTADRRAARRDRLDAARRAANTPATRTFSPAPRPNSPTCCWSGSGRALPASGCGPATLPDDLRRSPRAWCPNCSGAGRSATPTRPTPCGACSDCPRPANRYVDHPR